MEKERILYLDYLKTLAIILVVMFHCGLGGVFAKTLYSVCCPIFFAVNGFLMYQHERSTNDIIKKNLKIVILMAFWSLSLTALMMALRNNFNLYDFSRNVYYLGQGHCNHLWFIASLFILNVFYLLSYDFIHKSTTNYLLLLIFLILCCLDLPKYITWRFNPFEGWIERFSICYFVFGYGLLRYKVFDKAPTWTLCLLAILVYVVKVHLNAPLNYDITFAGYGSFLVMILTACIILIYKRLPLKKIKFVDFCSRNSLAIYLLHVAIYFPVQHFFPIVRDYPFAFVIGVFVSTCMLAYILSINKITRYIITL